MKNQKQIVYLYFEDNNMLTQSQKQKIKQYKARRQAAAPVTMHPPFVPGDHLVGIYDRDDTHLGFNGHGDIMVVKTEDDQEVGVWRNGYVNKAVDL